MDDHHWILQAAVVALVSMNPSSVIQLCGIFSFLQFPRKLSQTELEYKKHLLGILDLKKFRCIPPSVMCFMLTTNLLCSLALVHRPVLWWFHTCFKRLMLASASLSLLPPLFAYRGWCKGLNMQYHCSIRKAVRYVMSMRCFFVCFLDFWGKKPNCVDCLSRFSVLCCSAFWFSKHVIVRFKTQSTCK